MAGLMHFDKIVKGTPAHTRIFVEYSINILDRINNLLQQKYNGEYNIIAEKMGISENEVYLIFNGVQNYNLEIISKLEAIFEEKIIQVL